LLNQQARVIHAHVVSQVLYLFRTVVRQQIPRSTPLPLLAPLAYPCFERYNSPLELPLSQATILPELKFMNSDSFKLLDPIN